MRWASHRGRGYAVEAQECTVNTLTGLEGEGNSPELKLISACPICKSTDTTYAGKVRKRAMYYCPHCEVEFEAVVPRVEGGRR